MDLYKKNVIKAGEVVNSGRTVPLSGAGKSIPAPNGGKEKHSAGPLSPKDQFSEERIIELTDREIKKREQSAYENGYSAGIKAQSKDIAAKLEILGEISKTIPQIKKDILEKGEAQMVKLAIAIAEKIVHQEVSTHKEVILEVLKEALKNVAETEGIKIHLHPHDFRYMMEVKKDFLQSFDGIRNMIFEEDSSVKRGGAVVETMFGEVDARLESQLKEIRTALLQTR